MLCYRAAAEEAGKAGTREELGLLLPDNGVLPQFLFGGFDASG